MHGDLRSNIFAIPPDLAQSILKLSISSQTCAWHQFLSFYKYKCGENLWLMPFLISTQFDNDGQYFHQDTIPGLIKFQFNYLFERLGINQRTNGILKILGPKLYTFFVVDRLMYWRVYRAGLYSVTAGKVL